MEKGLKIIIITLTVLTIAGLLTIGAVFAYVRFFYVPKANATVPDNVIGETSISTKFDSQGAQPDDGTVILKTAGPKNSIQLYAKKPGDSVPFNVAGMLPGDSESINYGIRIYHSDTITVNFRALVITDTGSLSNALCIKVVLENNNTVLYDGVIGNMPEYLSVTARKNSDNVTNLDYVITAYLPTSTDNEHQGKSLNATFEWSVPETQFLLPPTGDRGAMFILLGVLGVAFIATATVYGISKTKSRGAKA